MAPGEQFVPVVYRTIMHGAPVQVSALSTRPTTGTTSTARRSTLTRACAPGMAADLLIHSSSDLNVSRRYPLSSVPGLYLAIMAPSRAPPACPRTEAVDP
jgi:hypothetical protein